MNIDHNLLTCSISSELDQYYDEDFTTLANFNVFGIERPIERSRSFALHNRHQKSFSRVQQIVFLTESSQIEKNWREAFEQKIQKKYCLEFKLSQVNTKLMNEIAENKKLESHDAQYQSRSSRRLQSFQASRLLPSQSANTKIFGNLSNLNSAVNSNNFDFERIKSFMSAVLNNDPDEFIWNKVYDAVKVVTIVLKPIPQPTTPPTSVLPTYKVIGEFKAFNRDKKGTLLHLGRYVRDVFSCQPTRLAVG